MIHNDTDFMAGIVVGRGDDTLRLVYADFLDERGQGDDHARAELIRVQCSLAGLRESKPIECKEWHTTSVSPSHWCPLCAWEEAVYPAERREVALIAANPQFRPTCPVCGGSGDDGGHEYDRGMKGECNFCSGTGRTGKLTRGFLDSVEVPTMVTVLTNECPVCRGPNATHYNSPSNPCFQCRGCAVGDWRKTPWARDLIREFPTLTRVVVREIGWAICQRLEGEWRWIDNTSASLNHDLSQGMFPKGRYKSQTEALDALAVAVCDVLRELCGQRHTTEQLPTTRK